MTWRRSAPLTVGEDEQREVFTRILFGIWNATGGDERRTVLWFAAFNRSLKDEAEREGQ